MFQHVCGGSVAVKCLLDRSNPAMLNALRHLTTVGIIQRQFDIQCTHALSDASARAEKRQPNVLGFDTRLCYSTRRAATFLPYLLDPQREPLVVDLFEGQGTYFFEKNPAARKRHRSPAEAVAGFFLDAIRRLLGI